MSINDCSLLITESNAVAYLFCSVVASFAPPPTSLNAAAKTGLILESSLFFEIKSLVKTVLSFSVSVSSFNLAIRLALYTWKIWLTG
jgi:hypothetical protein